jgi:hypothetical protein
MPKNMPSKKIIFIVGPQLNLPDANELSFRHARLMLQRQGFATSVQQHAGGTALRDCDGVAILPGITPAERSTTVVLREARSHGIPVKTIYQWLLS